ncbi:helix-turn-helix domain-containing protein [Nonomuraea sp. NPDC059023]|uniref:helix-turn-helix domain-containing protein n=1 Tax=unclassified Nonomuraea TaxID=2593643 RepID=UPI0036B40779
MSTQAMVWALEDAPDVPAQALGVLMGLANHADEHGRGAYPEQATLAEYARKSGRQARTDLTRLEELGLIRRGDQSLVAHLREDRRPVVWDVAMERRKEKSGRKSTSGGKPTSGRKSGVSEDEIAGDEPAPGSGLPGGSEVPAGSTASNGRKSTSDEPSVEPSEGCSLPTGENNTSAHTRDSTSGDSSKPKRKRATKAELEEREQQAQDLTTKFFERYETAQKFIAIRQVLLGVLGNGISRDRLAIVIDRLGREQKPISGASIQFVLGQLKDEQERRNGNTRAGPRGRPATPPTTSPRNRWMERE